MQDQDEREITIASLKAEIDALQARLAEFEPTTTGTQPVEDARPESKVRSRKLTEAASHGIARQNTDEEALERWAQALEALQATVLNITVHQDLPTLLETIVERAVRLLEAPGGGLYLCEPAQEQVRLVVSHNLPVDYRDTVLAYGEGAAGTVAQSGQPLSINDYRIWARRATVFDQEQPFAAVLATPMIWQGQVIGIIDIVHFSAGHSFTQTDLDLLSLFANHAAIAVQNARLLEQAQVDEARFRSIVESSPMGMHMYELQPDGSLMFKGANPSADTILGADNSIFVGKTIEEAFPALAKSEIPSQYRAVASTGRAWQADQIMYHQGQISGVFEVHAFQTSPGKVTAAFLDITDRRAAEEELRRLKEFNESIVQNISEGIAVQNAQGAFTFINPAAATMMGYEPEELASRHWTEVVPVDQQPIVQAADERRLDGKTDRYVVELLCKDGSRLPVVIGGSPRYDATSGQFKGSLAVFTNISEQLRAEDKLARHAREMEALYETSLEINYQHDLPTLLTAIVERATKLVEARTGGLYLIQPGTDTLELAVVYNLPHSFVGTTLQIGEGLSGRIALTGAPLMIEDYSQWQGQAPVFAQGPFRRVLGVPLRVGDKVLGVINVADDQQTGPFDEDEIRLVSLFADQAAIAVENARLFASEARRRREAETLQAATQALSTSLELQQVLELILAELSHVVPYDSATVQQLNGDQTVIIGGYGFPNMEKLLGVTFDLKATDNPNHEVIRTLTPVILRDAPAVYEEFRREPHAQAGIRSWLGVPLLFGDQAIGMLALDKREPGFYTTAHAELATAFAAQAAIAMENARLFGAGREQRDLNQALRQAMTAVNSSLDLDQILDQILRQVDRVIPSDAANINLIEEGWTHVVRARGYGRIHTDIETVSLCVADTPSLRQMLETGEALVISDTATDPNWTDLPNFDWSRSYAGAPIHARDRVIGFLNIDSATPGFFIQAHGDRLQAFADEVSMAISNAQLFQAEREQRELAEAQRLATVAVSSTLELDQVLDTILEQVSRVIPDDSANIILIEDEGIRVVRWRGYERPQDEEYLRSLAFNVADSPHLLKMRQTGQALVIPDTRLYPGWTQTSTQVRSYAGAPIRVRDQVIGFLNINKNTSDFFQQSHADRLQAFADQAGLAIGNARFFQTVEQGKRDWEATFDTMQEAVALVDGECRIIRTNLAFSEVAQKPFREILGKVYDTVLTGQPCSKAPCPLEHAIETGQPGSCVHRYNDRSYEAKVTPVPASSMGHTGSPARAIYALHDITEQRQAEEEIRRRNRELTLLNRVIAASAASLSIESILEVVCRELSLALDAPQSAAALINDEGTEAIVIAEYIAEGRPSAIGDIIPVVGNPSTEYLLEHKAPLVVGDAQNDPDLSSIRELMRRRGTVSMLLLPLIVEGEVVGSLGVDAIEPRVFAPDQVAMAQRVADQVSGAIARAYLEETQRHLTAAVEQADESILITDTDGVIFYVNPAFERVSGYGRDEAIGHNARILKSGKHDQAFFQELWETIVSGQVWQGRFINRKKDGSLYTEDSTITPVRDQTGKIVNYVAVNHDVTQMVQMEEQFRQAQKMEALGQLAGGIAHDFNNLLTIIQLSTRLLQRNIRPEDPLGEHIQRIQDTGERAGALTKQLLSFSRREVVEPRILTLNQVVSDLSRMLKRIIGEDIDLVTELGDKLWHVRIDPTQVDQVVLNLVVNARDAMPHGGTLLIATTNATLDEAYAAHNVGVLPGEYVLLSISDTGVGIDEDTQAHIFEPFFTTKERGQGTGLGLAAVFGIVKQNKGHVRFHSTMGEGTTFRIYLPRADAMRAEAEARALAPLAASLVRGTETILVVEDESQVLDLTVRVLRACGYEVLTAGDGPLALEVSRKHEGPIHLLITDVVMPRMYGKDLAEQLQKERAEMRLLFMSGYPDGATAHTDVLVPGASFLSKPFTVEKLTQTTRAVLDGKKDRA